MKFHLFTLFLFIACCSLSPSIQALSLRDAALKGISGKSCTAAKVDMLFVLDSSGSIGYADYELQKQALADFVNNSVTVGPNATRIAVITFSYSSSIDLDWSTDKEYTVKTIKQLNYQGGGTSTGEALTQARDSVFTDARSTATKVLLIFTDGQSNGNIKPIPVAQTLKNQGVQIISIGIGNNLDVTELNGMSSTGDYIVVASYQDLQNALGDILAETCDTVQEGEDIEALKNAKVDLVIAVDNAGSIGQQNFSLQKVALANFITQKLTIGDSSFRVGITAFHNSETNDLTWFTNARDVANLIMSFQYESTTVDMASSLIRIRDSLFTSARSKAAKMFFLFTDGASTAGAADPVPVVESIKKQKVQVIAIGVGSQVQPDKLKQFSSSGEFINSADFKTPERVLRNVLHETRQYVDKVFNSSPSLRYGIVGGSGIVTTVTYGFFCTLSSIIVAQVTRVF